MAERRVVSRAQLSDGTELHFVEAGQGPTLMLLHGGMGDCRSWDEQIDAFAARFRVLAYSRRLNDPNHNALPSVHPSLDDDAADLLGLQDVLRAGPMHLVATSYGALVALAFALRHPARVLSLVLVEPPLLRWACATTRGKRLHDAFMRRSWLPAARAFDKGKDHEALRWLTDGMWGRPVYQDLPQARKDAGLRNITAMRLLTQSADPFPDLPRETVAALPMPVLLVRGAQASALHRQVIDELAAVLPSARCKLVESAGHASPVENPHGFNEAVFGFLAGLGDR
jgi:pimeloyl-ACP methyl ester carboxylesterase